jgi:hypothetical protein
MTTIVSAASSNHFKSVCQMLKSIPEDFHVIFYDIGLTDSERDFIQINFPKVVVRIFDFSKYPKHVLLSSPDAGAYAWKPIIIHEVYSQLTDGIFLWCDAGNVIGGNIRKIEDFVQANKIYTITSSNDIKRWTHPISIKYMNIPEDFLHLDMRNAACIGFLCRDELVKNFIDEFKNFALVKDAILPEGANKTNHRWDQSILTYLFYKYKIIDERSYFGMYNIQQDID